MIPYKEQAEFIIITKGKCPTQFCGICMINDTTGYSGGAGCSKELAYQVANKYICDQLRRDTEV